MTEHDHDGWPEECRDPCDRPHPKTLCITVEPFEGMRDGTVEAARTAASGESVSGVVSFVSVGKLRWILTGRRIELSCALVATDGAAESIAALADALDRDYRPVHGDVGVLERYGLVFSVEECRAKRPFLPTGTFTSTWSSPLERPKNLPQRRRSRARPPYRNRPRGPGSCTIPRPH